MSKIKNSLCTKLHNTWHIFLNRLVDENTLLEAASIFFHHHFDYYLSVQRIIIHAALVLLHMSWCTNVNDKPQPCHGFRCKTSALIMSGYLARLLDSWNLKSEILWIHSENLWSVVFSAGQNMTGPNRVMGGAKLCWRWEAASSTCKDQM